MPLSTVPGMGDTTNRIVWSELRHNYGEASDIPGLLRACAGSDADTACDALADLSNKPYHQGGWVCSAASATLPILADLADLADLAADGAVHYRHEVVELIGLLAREAVTAADKFVDRDWPAALEATGPRLLALLGDPDARVRRAATLLVADGIRHPDSVTALSRRWVVETDRVTRVDLVLAFGAVCTWMPDEALRADLVALLAGDDPQLRLAAVHALAESDPTVAADQVSMLVRAVVDPDAVLWQDSSWIGGTPATIVYATGALLASDPVGATVFAVGAARDDDPHRRVATLGHAQLVRSQWRTATDGLLPLLIRSLDDDVPEARYRAAALFACLGPDAAAHADHLVARTTDAAMRDSRTRTTVGDAAVWALARQGHADCLPGLVERLSGDRLGFDTMLVHSGREMPGLAQPAICEVLVPLRRHAGVLLGPLAARRDLTSSLCRVVEAWGPDAAVALPAIVDAAADEKLHDLAVKAMGAIGPAAADAARTVLRDVDEPTAAWALWRTGADPDLGLTALTRHLTRPGARHTTIALVADLGADAVECTDICTDILGTSMRSADEWTRTEAAHAL